MRLRGLFSRSIFTLSTLLPLALSLSFHSPFDLVAFFTFYLHLALSLARHDALGYAFVVRRCILSCLPLPALVVGCLATRGSLGGRLIGRISPRGRLSHSSNASNWFLLLYFLRRLFSPRPVITRLNPQTISVSEKLLCTLPSVPRARVPVRTLDGRYKELLCCSVSDRDFCARVPLPRS